MNRRPDTRQIPEGSQPTTAVDKELLQLRDEMQHEREMLAKERLALTDRIRALENKSQVEVDMRSQIANLEAAIRHGNTLPAAGGSGVVIVVRRGEFIAYNTRLKHNNVIGGWVQAVESDKVSPAVPMIAVANEDFQYDQDFGAPYHSVRFQIYKRFFKDPRRKQVVGNGLPTPLIETPGVPQLTMV